MAKARRGMTRVVHIGVDAGSFAILDGLASRGVMPHYAELKGRSGRSTLRSTVPSFTVPGWVSLMTGVPATRHGLISWTTAGPKDHWGRADADRFVTSGDIPYP